MTIDEYCNALDSVTKECRHQPKTALRHIMYDRLMRDRAFWTAHPRMAEVLKREFERLIERGVSA